MRISEWSSDVCSSDLRHVRQAELEKPVAASRLTVIVALRRCPREDLDLPVVEPEAAIDRGDLRFDGAFVGKEKTGLATLDDGGSNRRAVDIRERLRGENDARVFLSQRLQPFAQLTSKRIVIECEPTLVDDEECWSTVEPIFDAVKEIAKDCRCGIGADQSFGLEGLDVAFSEMLGLGVEKPSVRTAHTIRSEEHTSELQSLMRISYAVFCMKKTNNTTKTHQ